MKYIVLVFIFYIFIKVQCVNIRPVVMSLEVADKEPAKIGPLSSITYKTVHKYYCATDLLPGVNLILYGTKAWTFKQQDVNLTLSYPTTNQAFSDDSRYLVTGFKVVLHIDGTNTNGSITAGGVLQEGITMTFTAQNISRLQYQFWVYGVRLETGASAELTATMYDMCT